MLALPLALAAAGAGGGTNFNVDIDLTSEGGRLATFFCWHGHVNVRYRFTYKSHVSMLVQVWHICAT